MRLTVPFSSLTRTRCKFGLNVRLVALVTWRPIPPFFFAKPFRTILRPLMVFFPVIAHSLPISNTSVVFPSKLFCSARGWESKYFRWLCKVKSQVSPTLPKKGSFPINRDERTAGCLEGDIRFIKASSPQRTLEPLRVARYFPPGNYQSQGSWPPGGRRSVATPFLRDPSVGTLHPEGESVECQSGQKASPIVLGKEPEKEGMSVPGST